MTPSTFLVLGATGGTGKHFVKRALADGHKVRAFIRSPAKLKQLLPDDADRVEIVQGSITDEVIDTDKLVRGVDYVVAMLGDREAQANAQINTAFVKKLIPSMRQHNVRRFLYLAGGFTRPYAGYNSWFGMAYSPALWILRHTLIRSYDGQHRDNEAVLKYLAEEAMDIEWIAHHAGIGSDGPSKGVLERTTGPPSVGTHYDCAIYNYMTVMDASAVHTSDFSRYVVNN